MASNMAEFGTAHPGVEELAYQQPNTGAAPHRTFRVLVVDGEERNRSTIAATLQDHGYEVEMASSDLQAVESLERRPFDLVLTDISIPSGNGIALLEQIRSWQPELPVVIVTAVREIGVVIEAMRRGAWDYLLKPIESESLLRSAQRALEHRRTLRESHDYRDELERAVRARTEMLGQAIEELEHSYDFTLEALGDALDLKDSETEGHSKRVTAYTIALARAMRISPAEIKVIARGAFLHDIGKMAIPDDILRKPGQFTPEEREIMHGHCAHGYNIVRKIPFLSEPAEIVYAHQEFFNGNGYPRRLSGSQIPIGARIFSIADAMDAITSDRPYRRARGFDEAREEILRCSGGQFDPRIVEVYSGLPGELWQELRAEIVSRNRQFSTFDIEQALNPPSR